MNDFSPHGEDLFGNSADEKHSSVLGDKFLIPPFTVLNAREGWWQERKRTWLALGIQSELGRGGASGQQISDVGNGSTLEADRRPGSNRRTQAGGGG